MRSNFGFTLIELMIAVVVVAITLSLAIPGFKSIIHANRAATVSNQLISALHLARSEAVKRGRDVVVCRNSGGSCVDGTDWSGPRCPVAEQRC